MKRSGLRLAIVVGVLVLAPIAACLMLGLFAAGAAGIALFIPEPEPAAQIVLADDDYRISLAVPAGWVAMDPVDVEGTDMQALFGVLRADGHWALMSAHVASQTLAPGSLHEYARALIDPEATLLPGECPIRVAGIEGRAARYESPAMGRVMWVVSFARPGWVYHLFGNDLVPGDGTAAELAASVQLLGGEPSPRARGARTDSSSRTWRVRDALFESAETREPSGRSRVPKARSSRSRFRRPGEAASPTPRGSASQSRCPISQWPPASPGRTSRRPR